jgi:hypothetical protein
MNATLQPCRSMHCECAFGKCTHPGFFDARHVSLDYNITSPSDEPETIVAAAVRIAVSSEWSSQIWRDKPVYPSYLTVTAPPPARHHTLMHPLSDDAIRIGPSDQGFLTSKGRYVSREEAMEIVIVSGQPTLPGTVCKSGAPLFSEDLW